MAREQPVHAAGEAGVARGWRHVGHHDVLFAEIEPLRMAALALARLFRGAIGRDVARVALAGSGRHKGAIGAVGIVQVSKGVVALEAGGDGVGAICEAVGGIVLAVEARGGFRAHVVVIVAIRFPFVLLAGAAIDD